MVLFKDYSTNKKSITVTGLITTFFLTVASIVINFVVMLQGKTPSEGMTFACIAFFSVFAGLYWNKRFRASSTGIEVA